MILFQRTLLMLSGISLSLCGPVYGGEPFNPKSDMGYRQEQNIVYAEVHGAGLLLDVFTPREKSNGLGIVHVVSGAWFSDRGKIRDLKRARMFETFCQRGYTVFAFRPGSMSKFTVPEMVIHLKLGLRWVKLRADRYGIDSENMAVTGASAGGHLASLLALTNSKAQDDREPTITAAAVFFPPTDFNQYGAYQPNPKDNNALGFLVRQLVFPRGVDDLTDEKIQEGITQISPAQQVHSNAPPFLLIHGDADPLVPLQQSQLFLERLKEKNISAELVIKPGGAHPWPTIHEEVKVLANWIDGQLSPVIAESQKDE